MAVVRVPEQSKTFHDDADVARILAAIGIDYARVEVPEEVAAAPADRVLATYEREIAELKNALDGLIETATEYPVAVDPPELVTAAVAVSV